MKVQGKGSKSWNTCNLYNYYQLMIKAVMYVLTEMACREESQVDSICQCQHLKPSFRYGNKVIMSSAVISQFHVYPMNC